MDNKWFVIPLPWQYKLWARQVWHEHHDNIEWHVWISTNKQAYMYKTNSAWYFWCSLVLVAQPLIFLQRAGLPDYFWCWVCLSADNLLSFWYFWRQLTAVFPQWPVRYLFKYVAKQPISLITKCAKQVEGCMLYLFQHLFIKLLALEWTELVPVLKTIPCWFSLSSLQHCTATNVYKVDIHVLLFRLNV